MPCDDFVWPEIALNAPLVVIPLDPTRPCSLFNCILADSGAGSIGTYNWVLLFGAIVKERNILAYEAAMRRMLGTGQYNEIVRAMDRRDELLAAGVPEGGITERVCAEMGFGSERLIQ